MSKYQQGKIYKIISESTDKIYIGSTILPLNKRFNLHMSDYRKWVNDKGKFHGSYEMIFQGNAKIELIENYPCNFKQELFKREQYYHDKNKDKITNLMNAHGLDLEKQEERQKYHNKKNYKKNLIEKMKSINCDYCNVTQMKCNMAKHRKTIKHKDNEKYFDSILNEE
jgi:hypothetical protein